MFYCWLTFHASLTCYSTHVQALGMSSLNFSLSVTAQMIRVYGKAREGSITPVSEDDERDRHCKLITRNFIVSSLSLPFLLFFLSFFFFFFLMVKDWNTKNQFLCTCLVYAQEEFVNLFNAVQTDIDAFKILDTEGRGKLRLDQVRTAIHQKGYQLDDTAFYTCCKSFDPDRTGDMGIPEYVALNLFLLSARNTFAAFDFNKTGVISLNFGQFIYASANCR